MTSSRNRRQRRALTCASCFAVFGGIGDQRRKSLMSGSSVGGRCELRARRFDVAFEMDDRAFELAVAPQAERVAVGVDQVRQRLELVPLLLVVRIVELARIGALARRLDLDEADERLADGDRIIRARLQVG